MLMYECRAEYVEINLISKSDQEILKEKFKMDNVEIENRIIYA